MIGKMLIHAVIATLLIASAAAVYANTLGNPVSSIVGSESQAKDTAHDDE